MIPNQGALELLYQLLVDNSGATFQLFTNNETIDANTVLADLTLAAWSGYSGVGLGTFSTPSIVSGKATASAVSNPNFVNSSGSPVDFYGWCIVDGGASKLLAAENIGLTTIPAGEGYLFSLTGTLRQDPS